MSDFVDFANIAAWSLQISRRCTIEILIENCPQKSDTESILVGSIRKRVNIAKAERLTELALEPAELSWLQDAVRWLRGKDAITGSKWAHLVDALRGAKDCESSA